MVTETGGSGQVDNMKQERPTLGFTNRYLAFPPSAPHSE
jgi:hypothetical protein